MLLAALTLTGGAAPAAAAGPCEGLLALTLPNTVVTSASVAPPSGTVPASCRVHATVTHPPAGDTVNVDVWLPVEGWNGRFQGVGGGGYAGGFPQALAAPLSQGFAAASTDTGHPGGSGDFALDADGRLNWQLIRDFAYLGIHDMTVVGKAVTAAFYGRPARYAYFNGCSTGGRQGLSEAQRYPGGLRRDPVGRPGDQLVAVHPRRAVAPARHAPGRRLPAAVQVRGQLFAQSVEQYTSVIGTDNPDLRSFKRAGGKVVIWHGLVDQLIFPQGTVRYYERVKARMGGARRTEEFARLFLAPGVAHCAGGPGPQPNAPLNAVIDWVERGRAPRVLDGVVRDAGGAVTQTRPICLYPEVAAYKGHGDVAAASSFACRRSG
jgi:hypothetical protein